MINYQSSTACSPYFISPFKLSIFSKFKPFLLVYISNSNPIIFCLTNLIDNLDRPFPLERSWIFNCILNVLSIIEYVLGVVIWCWYDVLLNLWCLLVAYTWSVDPQHVCIILRRRVHRIDLSLNYWWVLNVWMHLDQWWFLLGIGQSSNDGGHYENVY